MAIDAHLRTHLQRLLCSSRRVRRLRVYVCVYARARARVQTNSVRAQRLCEIVMFVAQLCIGKLLATHAMGL
jgi:hypothetical protein